MLLTAILQAHFHTGAEALALSRVTNVYEAPRFTLLTPALLRTDSQENIYLQADDLSSPITASIAIHDFDESVLLLQDSVQLNQANNYHALKPIQVRQPKI